jgi:hypothetical protein
LQTSPGFNPNEGRNLNKGCVVVLWASGIVSEPHWTVLAWIYLLQHLCKSRG